MQGNDGRCILWTGVPVEYLPVGLRCILVISSFRNPRIEFVMVCGRACRHIPTTSIEIRRHREKIQERCWTRSRRCVFGEGDHDKARRRHRRATKRRSWSRRAFVGARSMPVCRWTGQSPSRLLLLCNLQAFAAPGFLNFVLTHLPAVPLWANAQRRRSGLRGFPSHSTPACASSAHLST